MLLFKHNILTEKWPNEKNVKETLFNQMEKQFNSYQKPSVKNSISFRLKDADEDEPVMTEFKEL